MIHHVIIHLTALPKVHVFKLPKFHLPKPKFIKIKK